MTDAAAPNSVFPALRQVWREAGPIAKAIVNATEGYASRSVDDVYAAFNPLFANANLLFLPSYNVVNLEHREGFDDYGRPAMLRWACVGGTFTFVGPEGDACTVTTIGEAADSSDKAVNIAMQAALKYALLQTFLVPVAAGDQDINSPRQSPPEPLPNNVVPIHQVPQQVQQPAPQPIQAGGLREQVQQAAQQVGIPVAPSVQQAPPQQYNDQPPRPAPQPTGEGLSAKQGKTIFAISKALEWDRARILQEIELVCGVSVKSDRDLTKQQASKLIDAMNERQHRPQAPAPVDPGFGFTDEPF